MLHYLFVIYYECDRNNNDKNHNNNIRSSSSSRAGPSRKVCIADKAVLISIKVV